MCATFESNDGWDRAKAQALLAQHFPQLTPQVRARTRACVRACLLVCVRVYARVYACVHACVYVCVCMRACECISEYVCMCMCVCISEYVCVYATFESNHGWDWAPYYLGATASPRLTRGTDMKAMRASLLCTTNINTTTNAGSQRAAPPQGLLLPRSHGAARRRDTGCPAHGAAAGRA